jgi:hypothetical protein
MNQGYAGATTSISNNLGGSLSGVGLQPVPDCLTTHVDKLAANIAHLEEEVGTLRSQLSPVLKPQPPTANTNEAKALVPMRSQMSETVVGQIERVRSLIAQVRSLRDVLDIA